MANTMASRHTLNTLEVRLNDIWISCQKEMLEMRDQIKKLSDYVKTSDLMLEEMSKMNETLVNIIEDRRVNGSNSKTLYKLYAEFSELEESVDRQKDNLLAVKKSLNANNRHNVMDLIHSWRRVTETRDQFIQTHDVIVNNMSEDLPNSEPIRGTISDTIAVKYDNNAVDINLSDDDYQPVDEDMKTTRHQFVQTHDTIVDNLFEVIPQIESNETIHKAVDENVNESNDNFSDDDYQPVDEDMEQMDDRSSGVSDSVGEYMAEVNRICDSDSEYEVKRKRKSPKKFKKSKRIAKCFDITEADMDQVIRPEHKRTDDYMCDQIDCTFSTADRFRFYNHLKRHKTSGMSAEVFRRSERVDDELLPMTDHKLKAFVCNWESCKYWSRNKTVFYNHHLRHQKGTQKCVTEVKELVSNPMDKLCKSRMKTVRNLYSEMDLLILPEHILDNQYVCNDIMCHFKTEDKERFYNHLRRHPSKDSNPQHFRQMERRDDLLMLLLDRKTRIYACDRSDCGYRSTNKKVIHKHIIAHNGAEAVATEVTVELARKRAAQARKMELRNERIGKYKVDDQYVCDEIDCNFKAVGKKTFHEHWLMHNPLSVRRRRSAAPGIDRTLERKRDRLVATDVTVQLAQKRRHSRQNYELMNKRVAKYKVDDQYVCDEIDCNFKSLNKKTFHNHWLMHNPNPKTVRRRRRSAAPGIDWTLERPFVCDWLDCGFATNSRKNLNRHADSHRGIKRLACDWPGCDFRCNRNDHMKAHRGVHTQERPQACTWPGCEYRANTKGTLRCHMRTHTGEKPFVCAFPECGFRATQAWVVTTHQRMHTGEKPYVCPEKGCGFTSASSLYLHRKRCHGSVERVWTAKRGRKPKHSPRVDTQPNYSSNNVIVEESVNSEVITNLIIN